MQLALGQPVTLRSGLQVTVVGEADIVDNNRKTKQIIGRLPTPKFVGEQLVPYILFHPYEVNNE